MSEEQSYKLSRKTHVLHLFSQCRSTFCMFYMFIHRMPERLLVNLASCHLTFSHNYADYLTTQAKEVKVFRRTCAVILEF